MLLKADYLENNLFNASKIQGPLKHAVNVTSFLSKVHNYNLNIDVFSRSLKKKKAMKTDFKRLILQQLQVGNDCLH